MFEEYERVMIQSSGVVGVIVDKRFVNGQAVYIVEADQWNENGDYPLYDCLDADLIKTEQ